MLKKTIFMFINKKVLIKCTLYFGWYPETNIRLYKDRWILKRAISLSLISQLFVRIALVSS